MKKIFTLVIFIHVFLGHSQIQTKSQKVVEVLEPQAFYLNGGAKNLMGGSSRIGFKIDLPPNTVEWYYAFTTEPNNDKEQTIELENQLGLLLSTLGYSPTLINLIKIPEGQGLIDVFLTDRNGYNTFFEKDFFDMWKYKSPGHIVEGSRTNMKEGKVKIDDVQSGSHFLVIRNTSGTIGANIKLEVVAVVEELTTDLSLWDKKSRDFLFNSLRGDIKRSFPEYSEDKIDEVTGCAITKFTKELKPTDITTLAEYELKAIVKKYIAECNE